MVDSGKVEKVKWVKWVLETNQSHESFYLSIIVFRHQVHVLPGQIVNTAQTCQILVAIRIATVIQLEHGCPTRQEEHVRKTSAVHSHQNVRIANDFQLLFKWHSGHAEIRKEYLLTNKIQLHYLQRTYVSKVTS